MTIRKFFFWLHLIAGLLAGLVVFIMSLSGVLLAYERQIVAAKIPVHCCAPPAGSQQNTKMPMETLLARVTAGDPARPTSITLRRDADTPLEVGFGREKTLFVNPYTGALLPDPARSTRAFFSFVEGWHRWLGASMQQHDAGRAVTGACNLLFLFIVCSGIYLWWPRAWTSRLLKPIVTFRPGLSGKARDFNWHNVIGFWSALPLFIVVLTGVVMSYPWANNLLYRAVGSKPPAPGQGPGGGPPGGGGERERGGRGDRANASAAREGAGPRGDRDNVQAGNQSHGDHPGRQGRHHRDEAQAASASVGAPSPFAGFDLLWLRAEQQQRDWRTITLRIPSRESAPLVFSIDRGNGGRPDLRGQLTVDRAGNVVRWEPFETQDRGRRLRTWFRFAHTGEAAGLVGQTLAALASAGALFLVWTGWSLAIRRLSRWWRRRNAPVESTA